MESREKLEKQQRERLNLLKVARRSGSHPRRDSGAPRSLFPLPGVARPSGADDGLLFHAAFAGDAAESKKQE